MVQSGLMIKTKGIDHVVIWVSDLERSKRFYIDLLGMSIAHESRWQSFLRCGEQQLALFQVRDGAEVTSGAELNHMALVMEAANYAEVKAKLEHEGIEVTGRQGDDRCIYFDDPDGHRLQLLYLGHD